ncbi:MAG: septal ring lytic transglycosylase RlpA family protein [Hyphomicrobiaceae bacterium]|nr:septal ring lytic transglycosylase RlpA family protein [Hyphomicrobiaceae bacterium]
MTASLMLGACGTPNSSSPKALNLSKKVVNYGSRVPKGGGHYKIGKPYQIANKWYRPRENKNYDRVGTASWYGDLFHGRKTANGEVFDMDALTAAHPTLPLPTLVEVTNLANRRKIVVRVNDRGPYRHNRLIDLSRKAATILGFKKNGTAKVRVRYISRAPMNGDDRYEKQIYARNFSAQRLASSAQASPAVPQKSGLSRYKRGRASYTSGRARQASRDTSPSSLYGGSSSFSLGGEDF